MGAGELLNGGAITIDNLPIVCLSHIFSFLPIIDRIRIERVNKHWYLVSQQSWNSIKTFNLREEFWRTMNSKFALKISRDQFVKILKNCGKYIQHIDLTSQREGSSWFVDIEINDLIVSDIFNLCPGIKSLNLIRPKLDVNRKSVLKFVANNFKNLNQLTIGHYKSNNKVQIRHLLSNNNKLKQLTMMEMEIDSSYLKELNHTIIEELHFDKCGFTVDAFEELLSMLEKTEALHTLSFIECTCEKMRRNSLLQAIACNSKNLKKLELHFSKNNGWESEKFNNFESLTNLEVLKLSGEVALNDRSLTIIRKYCSKLEKVSLKDSNLVTDAGLESVISLPQLRHLCLDNLQRIESGVLKNMPNLQELECIGCDLLGYPYLINLLETSPKIEFVKFRLSCLGQLAFDALRPTKIIDCAIRSENNKLSVIVDAESTEFDDQCVYIKESMTKFAGCVIRKYVKSCLECFYESPYMRQKCGVCSNINSEEVYLI